MPPIVSWKLQYEKIRQDIAELNRAYKPANISFTLKEAFWAHMPPAFSEYKQPKEFIHQGGPASLNAYYWTKLEGRGVQEAHGIATWPWLVNDTVDEFGLSGTAHDGVDLVKAPHFKHSLVHEVGHWLGLVHSFTTIGDHGDWIDDTPLNPSGKGTDMAWPPENFMAYSDKASMFTRGQMSRMRATWAKWRAGDKTPAPVRAHSLPRIAPSTAKGPNTGGKFAFYPNPKDMYFTYRMCSTFPVEFVPEFREQYCGTRAYCIFGHYDGEEVPEGQDPPRYRGASDCLRDRIGSGPAKLPWMESDAAKVPSDSSNLAEYHEEIMGSSFICKAIPQLTKKQKILSKGQDLTGKFRSEEECVAAHERRPMDRESLPATSMWQLPELRP